MTSLGSLAWLTGTLSANTSAGGPTCRVQCSTSALAALASGFAQKSSGGMRARSLVVGRVQHGESPMMSVALALVPEMDSFLVRAILLESVDQRPDGYERPDAARNRQVLAERRQPLSSRQPWGATR